MSPGLRLMLMLIWIELMDTINWFDALLVVAVLILVPLVDSDRKRNR